MCVGSSESKLVDMCAYAEIARPVAVLTLSAILSKDCICMAVLDMPQGV